MRHRSFLPITIAFCLFSHAIDAAVYYVSPTGNDANNGTSQSTPWKTITRVNQLSFVFQPGDQILFQRGGSFGGTLLIASSGTTAQPIVVGAYGSGARPVFTGAQSITSWTVHSGNIWKASFAQAPKHLFVNHLLMTLARYPNSGWLTNDNGSSTTLTDAALTQPNGYWVGARAVIRSSNYSYHAPSVTGYSNGTLTYTDTYYNLGNWNWGYFLCNKLSELDMPGEWYYDAATAKCYLWAPGNANPNGLLVEGSTIAKGIQLAYNCHHIQIGSIAFEDFIDAAVSVETNTYVTVNDCSFSYCYVGVRAGGSNNTYTANTFSKIFDSAMFLMDNNATVQDNIFTDIAMLPGLGEGGWGYFGIRTTGSGVVIRGNRLTNVGYIGIVAEQNALIEKNVLDNMMAIMNDGSAIAFDHSNGMVIQDNIVRTVVGDMTSSASNSPYYYAYGHGIYFGNTSLQNTIVQRNTVTGCSGHGVHMDHTTVSTGNQVKDNVLYGNRVQLCISDASCGTFVPTFNDVVSGNLMYCTDKDQLCMMQYHVYSATPVDYGTYSNNLYYNPYNELSIFINVQFSGSQRYFSLERWQVERSEDAGSTRFPEQLRNAHAVTSVLASVPVVNGTFNSNVTGWGGFPGNAVVSHVTGQLDGGSLYANLPNNSIYNEFTMRNPDQFAIQGGQWYRLKCSLKSDTYGQVGIGVKPVSQVLTLLLAGERDYPFSPQRREIEYIFQNTYTENAYVQFQNWYTDPRYWLDNVTLERVAVVPVDPNTENVIFSNTTASSMNFTLPAGCWQEPGGVLTSGSIAVPSYRSRVFYKSTSTACGGSGTYTVGGKVMLSGALNWGTGIMRDDLRVAGLIPTNEPYTGFGHTLENAGATIGAAVSSATGNLAMVDWVLLELRNADASYSVAGKRAAIVRRDGTIVGTDGSSQIAFNVPTQGKYLVVRHRNHLGAMTASTLSANGVTVDFTALTTSLYGTNAMKSDGTRRALWPGNVNFDNVIRYTGISNDRDPILTAIGGLIPTNSVTGYLGSDTNMDAWVGYTGPANDRDHVLTTVGGVLPTSTKLEQVP